VNPEISSTGRFVDRIARNAALDAVADAVQPSLRKALEGSGAAAPLKDLLHGKQLGHSLHMAVTDLPVGAWTLAALFDGLEISGRKEFAKAADVAIGFGLLGGIVAIVTGLAEWCDTAGGPKRVGTAHAISNTIGFSAYAVSLGLRRGGRRGAGIACAMFGYVASSFAAYLGGELSTGLHIGIKHNVTPIVPANDFTAVLSESELLGREVKRADFRGIPVLLSRDTYGEIHAISAVCTHRGAPLETGKFDDECVVCPWHGARFTLVDGRVQEGPATFPLARFATRVVAGQIEIRPYFD